MAEKFELVAEIREDKGKGASRRLRRSGRVPAIIYGAAKPVQSLVFDHNELLRNLEQQAFLSSILTVSVAGKKESVILKDLQRHPARRQVLHLDLQRIVADEKIKMMVPIRFLNEEAALGVKLGGGVVSHLMSEVEIVCLPADLPEYLEIDIAELELDATRLLSDLTVPDGVEITDLIATPPQDRPIVSIHIPKVIEEPEEEEVVEGEELEALAEGEVPEGEEGAAPAEDAGDTEEKKED